MEYRGYNDYELLYMINSIHSDEALDIMIEKYEGLIVNKIKSFYFRYYSLDDLVMEGKMVLLKAIRKFNDSFNKTFTKFFELLLVNKLCDLYRIDKKEREIEYIDDPVSISFIEDDYSDDNIYISKDTEKYFLDNFSDIEKEVYTLFFKDNMSCYEISDYLLKDYLSISNTIQRIKKKIRTLYQKRYK